MNQPLTAQSTGRSSHCSQEYNLNASPHRNHSPDGHAHQNPLWPYGGRGHVDPQPKAPAVEVTRVNAGYDRTHPFRLQELSLTVNCGERVALVGPNGAGKSTLLKTIAGLLTPWRGSIRLFGNPVGACHHRTAYLPQRTDLNWDFPMTVFELVMTGRYVHLGWVLGPRQKDRELVSQGLRRLGISELAHRQIGELSGGQQQRTLLARAIVQEASLFLLDEPLNAVDEATRDIVDNVLAEEVNRGGSVLAATHDLGRLTESFDRSIYLKDGRIESSGS
ncbi:MAG: metal ABC transporter ATP-binding protein [Planctomyces sp.]